MAQDKRQALYDRIRATSKDEVVLEEMIRLGFWPARGEVPHDPADEIRARTEMQRELSALRTEQSRLGNVEALKKELYKRRLAASKAKQAETRARRERERLARAEGWKIRKAGDIVFLGREVSGGLSDTTCDEAKLTKQGLPVLRTAAEVARAAGVGVPELRFLSYARTTSRISHYRRFAIPKKAGGVRVISAPMPRLKRLQRWLLDSVLSHVEVHDAAHGFREGRSIVSNAKAHVGARVVVNMDLSDFFPGVLFPRVKGMFRALGYGDFVASVLALVATEPDMQTVVLDGRTFHVAEGPRRLPQGAPTSPAVTNVLCRRLDRRLFLAARKLGFVYTRYADDLTFSAHDDTSAARTGQLLAQARFIVEEEGFTPHPKKTRVLRRGRRQEVTGIVVNDGLGVEREKLRKFRALLHSIRATGIEGKTWGDSPDVLASARGFASYVAMVSPEKGRALLAQVAELEARFASARPPRTPKAGPPAKAVMPPAGREIPATPVATSEAPRPENVPPEAPKPEAPKPEAEAPKKKWWKLF